MVFARLTAVAGWPSVQVDLCVFVTEMKAFIGFKLFEHNRGAPRHGKSVVWTSSSQVLYLSAPRLSKQRLNSRVQFAHGIAHKLHALG